MTLEKWLFGHFLIITCRCVFLRFGQNEVSRRTACKTAAQALSVKNSKIESASNIDLLFLSHYNTFVFKRFLMFKHRHVARCCIRGEG